ncbi:MAG: glycosyl transferase family 1 [Hyphomicrobiales bacterium]|nr:glycosyl transferase family 1 [Hyphomicrobiales bacterium]
MAEGMNRRIEADIFPTPNQAPPAKPAPSRPPSANSLLPMLTGAPGPLSPLAGRRFLMTVAREAAPGQARPLADEMAFEDALAFAGHLAALDLDVVLAAVGEAFTPDDLRLLSRIPGVSAWNGGPVTRPQTDAAACVRELQTVADGVRADLILLHDPALAAARRDPRPTVVFCDASRIADWRRQHPHQASRLAPGDVQAASALERLGLHAADRVVAPTRAFASELVAAHGLTLPPSVLPPVFRKSEFHERRANDAAFIVAGAAIADPIDLQRLDRAAGQICGQTLLFDTKLSVADGESVRGICLENAHGLEPMGVAAAEALLLRATAFYSVATGTSFERLVWRAACTGCALILPDTRANREFWQGAAHFVEAGSETALAAALRRMLEDDDYRRRTAAAGLRRARALTGGPAIAGLHKLLASALGAAPLTGALQVP